jgi:hypothetical protein
VDKLKLKIGRTFWRRKRKAVNIDILNLYQIRLKIRLTNSGPLPRPYPRLVGGYKEEIIEIKVENTNERSFFLMIFI